VGEVIHQLRSSFDHLAWKLVEKNGIDPDSVRPRVEFPVYRDRQEYGTSGKGKIHSAVKGSEALIERLQPYNDGNAYVTNPLWIVHRLDIMDKHKLLFVVGATFQLESFTVGMVNRWSRPFDIEENAILRISPVSAVQMEPEFGFQIVLREVSLGPGGEPILELVQRLINFTLRTINGFESLLI
jgi:hypothetical protein